MIRKLSTIVLTAGAASCLAGTALAHPGHLGHSFTEGAIHPLVGLDHLLAMVAVGLLAVRLGGKAIWMLPLAFMGAMLLGGLLATAGVPLPAVETGIVASVLVLGAVVALVRTMPLVAGMCLVALFAMFHGHAHAEEMAAEGTFGMYALGFLASTALLHAGGVAGATILSKGWTPLAVRACGAAISAAGVYILL